MSEESAKILTLEDYHYHLFNKEFNRESTGEAMSFIITRNLMKEKKPEVLKMVITSPGGDVSSAFALIDTMKGSKIPIYTYGLGVVASCGVLTFIAGEKGHRYITKNTQILSHQYQWGSYDKYHELMSIVGEFKNIHKRFIRHYKKCTGLSKKEIKKYLLPAKDVWLTAQDAVDLGMADEIVDFY